MTPMLSLLVHVAGAALIVVGLWLAFVGLWLLAGMPTR